MTTIKGRVIERFTKRPVVGAAVATPAGNTYTNSIGEFEVDAPAGQTTVAVNAEGFRPFSQPIRVGAFGIMSVGDLAIDSVIRAF